MRILLQDKRTGLYLQNRDILTEEIDMARDFGDSQRALDYARLNHITGIQFVAEFVDGNYNQSVVLQLEPSPVARTVEIRAAARQ